MIKVASAIWGGFVRASDWMAAKALIQAVCAFLVLAALVSPARAALLTYDPTNTYVTSISGLSVDGALYDTTFHLNLSFNELWDADGDGIFGEGDGSVINHAPVFWGSPAHGHAAAVAIMDVLGSTEMTSSSGDAFLLPTGFDVTTPGYVNVIGDVDDRLALLYDQLRTRSVLVDQLYLPVVAPYVSFEASAVPLPGTFWLLAFGLGG